MTIPLCLNAGPKMENDYEDISSTCLKPANHAGPHVYTPDDEIPDDVDIPGMDQ